MNPKNKNPKSTIKTTKTQKMNKNSNFHKTLNQKVRKPYM